MCAFVENASNVVASRAGGVVLILAGVVAALVARFVA